MHLKGYTLLKFLLCAIILLIGCNGKKNQTEWQEYLGGPDRNHYSVLKEIDTTNIAQLKKVWEYHSGDSGQVQCNPIIINGILFGVTASNQVFALEGETGRQIWKFVQAGEPTSNVNRGVTYWENGEDKRILYAYGSYLYALNAQTGKIISSFGDKGKVSLKTGLDASTGDKFVGSTTPGTLFENLIIMPLRVAEEEEGAIGYIQAFDVISGKLVWVFKTIPGKEEKGAETWPQNFDKNTVGGANNWAGMAIDRKREIVYIPTGSASFDFYGGNRKGENLFANCLLALNARTGKYIWHFQMVHHDVWDKDLPAPPNLLTVKHHGKSIDAVAQITKSGQVFLFNRENGKPLFDIDEKSFQPSNLTGEKTWPTQPIPKLPLPFVRQNISESDISNIAENRDELLKTYRSANKGFFQPLSLKQTILLPGADGGAEWGGAAVDPDGVLYVNANEMPWLFSLSYKSEDDQKTGLTVGNIIYNSKCATCHGADLKGNPASGYPSLTNIKEKSNRPQIAVIISSGKGMMPGFTNINALEKQSLIDYLFNDEKKEINESIKLSSSKKSLTPYKFNGYNKFLDNRGYAAIKPPWGTLTAIDMNTGKHIWQKPLGEFKELTAKGIPVTGTENYGGPVITAGGVLFIAATKDGMFRAYNKRTGAILFETALPAAGFATPSTYEINGKQYVVIACGGTKLGTKKGDSYIAFSL